MNKNSELARWAGSYKLIIKFSVMLVTAPVVRAPRL